MAFTLSYNDITVTLPSPEFGDALEKNYRKIVRESRGKELIIFPKYGYSYLSQFEKFDYQFKFVTEIIKQQLIDFLDSTLGLVVIITDYNNDTYNGIVLTPAVEIINAARNNNEFSLEVEITPSETENIITHDYLINGNLTNNIEISGGTSAFGSRVLGGTIVSCDPIVHASIGTTLVGTITVSGDNTSIVSFGTIIDNGGGSFTIVGGFLSWHVANAIVNYLS